MSAAKQATRKPWKGTMTARERFNRQMRFQPIDRCFNMEFGYWEENYRQWDIFTENGVTNEQQANAMFGFDPIAIAWGNIWLSPKFEAKVLERRGNLLVMQNEDGLTAEVAADNHSSIPHYTGASVASPDDWQRVKAERFRVDDPARIVDVEALIRAHPPERDYPLGVDCGSMIGRIRDLLTFEGICYAWADYPDMLEDMVETCCRM